MNKQIGIRIRLEMSPRVLEGHHRRRNRVSVWLRTLGLGDVGIEHVREIMLDFTQSKGVKVLHFDWSMDPEEELYRFGGDARKGVVRAIAVVSKPSPKLFRISSVHDTLVGTAYLRVKRSGHFSVVGKRITKRRPYHRDAGFRVGAGFGRKDRVWNFDPKRGSIIGHEPLKIEVG